MNNSFIRLQLWLADKIDAARKDERGALSTEGAIITAVIAGGAATIFGIIVAGATDVANNIPFVGG